MFARLGPRPEPVPLLGAQAFAHGMLCAFTIIPAAGIFLSSFGPEKLPYVYLLVAATGFLTAPFFARAMGRWAVAAVARPVLLGLVGLHLASWAVLSISDAAWPSVILQVLFPMSLQIGFVFLGTQAGRLLTMREMKAWFSIIASGFSVGFLLGGLIAPVIIDVAGGTKDILGLTAASAVLMLVLISVTHRRYPDVLSVGSASVRTAIPAPPTVAGAPVRPMIFLLFAYQVLSALGTQFAEFLLYDSAAARYSTSEDLARFTSHFNVWLNVCELLFLFLVAGPLLTRFGLRLGLFANPVVLTTAVIGAAFAAIGAGTGSLALFVAAGSARIGDIVLTNSTTRTATNTAYLALPVGIRPTVQARAEGIGVPGAIGLSGVILLIVVRLLNGGVPAVIGVTIAVCFMWLVATASLFTRYRRQLHKNLGHRILTPHLVAYGDAATDGMIDLLLHDDLSGGVDPSTAARRDPALLVAELAASLDDHAADGRRVAQLIRSARSHDPALVDTLVFIARHQSRDIRAMALRQLAVLMDRDDPRRSSLADEAIGLAASDAAEIVHALNRLPTGGAAVPVREALADEARTVRDNALYALALLLDIPTIDRARQWLVGDDRQRATALESIEVNTPRTHRSAIMGIMELDRDVATAERELRTSVREWPDTGDVLVDLRDDTRGVWNQPWLARCAAHALNVGRS